MTPDGEPLDDPVCETCGERGAPAPLPMDPDRLRPRAVLHVRISEEALRAGHGVAVADHGIGPVTLAQAVALLGHCRVTVRPVLDTRHQLPVDAYEIPTDMREALRLTRLSSVYPWTASGTHAVDVDHTDPYVPLHAGGTPGQTRLDNLGPLVRFAHRVKTHGRGWRHRQPSPGVYLWRTPHGYWFRVDRTGTHALGRDPTRSAHDAPSVVSRLESAFAELVAAA